MASLIISIHYRILETLHRVAISKPVRDTTYATLPLVEIKYFTGNFDFFIQARDQSKGVDFSSFAKALRKQSFEFVRTKF